MSVIIVPVETGVPLGINVVFKYGPVTMEFIYIICEFDPEFNATVERVSVVPAMYPLHRKLFTPLNILATLELLTMEVVTIVLFAAGNGP